MRKNTTIRKHKQTREKRIINITYLDILKNKATSLRCFNLKEMPFGTVSQMRKLDIVDGYWTFYFCPSKLQRENL